MNSISFDEAVKKIVERDDRFDVRAYSFLNAALDWTVRRIAEQKTERENSHVSGQELLQGFCDFSIDQFGPMAYTVLDEWGIHTGINVGEMVFLLIEEEVFSKQDGDSLADFRCKSLKKILTEPFEVSDEEVGLSTK